MHILARLEREHATHTHVNSKVLAMWQWGSYHAGKVLAMWHCSGHRVHRQFKVGFLFLPISPLESQYICILGTNVLLMFHLLLDVEL